MAIPKIFPTFRSSLAIINLVNMALWTTCLSKDHVLIRDMSKSSHMIYKLLKAFNINLYGKVHCPSENEANREHWLGKMLNIMTCTGNHSPTYFSPNAIFLQRNFFRAQKVQYQYHIAGSPWAKQAFKVRHPAHYCVGSKFHIWFSKSALFQAAKQISSCTL